MEKKIDNICPRCKQPKQYPDKDLCLFCWREENRLCIRCGVTISWMSKSFKYCPNCFKDMLSKNKEN